MHAIIGITGNVGGATARALLAAGKKVRGIVRDKSKAAAWEAAGVELAVVDVLDPSALGEALRGAEGVFVMVPPNFTPTANYPETRAIIASLRQTLDTVRPAKAVFLSSVGAHRQHGLGLITQSHILEQEMQSLPVAKAFIRAAWFMDNCQWDIGPARERGEIEAFLDPLDRPFPMVATEDIGALAAKTLQEEWSGNRYLELEGPRRYSQLDVAEILSRLLHSPVRAVPVPRDQWTALFEKRGTPKNRTAPRVEMLDGFNSGWIDFERNDTERAQGVCTLDKVLERLIRKSASQ